MSRDQSGDGADRPVGELERYAIDHALRAAWVSEWWNPFDPDFGYTDYFEAITARNLSLLHGFEELSEDAERRGVLPQSDDDQTKLVTDGGRRTDGPSRWSNPLREPHGRIGPGAVLYDIRDAERRPCCREGGRCLAHVVGVYEETETSEVYFRVQDGTHTTEHWCHQGDLLALYEPAGWSVDTAVKPTYTLTRRHGVEDHHDVMTDGGRVQDTEEVEHGSCVKHRCAGCHRIFDSVMNGTSCPHCGGASVCSLPHSEGNCS